MKPVRLLLLLITLAFFNINAAYSNHVIGGSITWECIKTGSDKGKFIFTVKKYRVCKLGVAGMAAPFITSPFSSGISTTLVGQQQINIPCYDPNLSMDCFGGTVAKQNNVIEEFTYKSAPVTLIGTPHATGSVFYTSECCRPSGITNVTSTGSFTWTAVMYPYIVNGNPLPLGSINNPSCYDSSPEFSDSPMPAACTKNPIYTYINVDDADNDSVAYKFAPSLTSVSLPVTYQTGFTYNNPLPSPGVPSSGLNVAASLDSITGQFSFNAHDSGTFMINIEIESYRNNQLIAINSREVPIIIVACPPLPPPFPTSTFNQPPAANFVYNSSPTAATTTINATAGDYIEFDLQGFDADFLPGFIPQSITVEGLGTNFGNGFSDSTSGCTNPPCVTVDTTVGNYNQLEQHWKKSSNISLPVKWQTSCSHIREVNGLPQPTLHHIRFKLYDDNCQIPGQSYANFNVMLWPDTSNNDFYSLDSIDLNPNNTTLYWPQYTGPGFNAYYIYKYDKTNSTYSIVKTENNVATTSFTDNSNAGINSYYISLDTIACKGGIVYSTLDLKLQQNTTGIAELSWNIPVVPATSTEIRYDIWKSGNGTSFSFHDSTRTLSYIDGSLGCDDSASYYVSAYYKNQYLTTSLIKQAIVVHPEDVFPFVNRIIKDTAGNVRIGWRPIPVQNAFFNSYQVYVSSDSLGPFTLVDSVVNIDSLQYNHLNASSISPTLYYYIKVKVISACNAALLATKRSNIVAANNLSIDTTGLGLLQLNWIPFYNAKSVGYFQVFRRYSNPGWAFLDFVQSGKTNFTDSLRECNRIIEYKVLIDTVGVLSQVNGYIFVEELSFSLTRLDEFTLVGMPGQKPKWYLEGSLISTESDTLTMRLPGTYYYTVRLNNGCLARSKDFLYLPSGLSDISGKNNMMVYPNPNSGVFNLQLSKGFGEDIKVTVHDQTGKIVYTDSYTNKGKLREIQLPENARGLYFVRVQSGNQEMNKKVLVK